MKKAEIDKLVVGSIIKYRSNDKEFRIVAIDGDEVYVKSITDRDSRIVTFNKLERWYYVVNN